MNITRTSIAGFLMEAKASRIFIQEEPRAVMDWPVWGLGWMHVEIYDTIEQQARRQR